MSEAGITPAAATHDLAPRSSTERVFGERARVAEPAAAFEYEPPFERESQIDAPPRIERAALVDAVLALAQTPEVRLVLLAGEAGAGKSFVLNAVAEQLHADRAWGVEALAAYPGSTLAHLVEPSGTLPELIRAVLLNVCDRLCVDDLDSCDALSLSLIERLLREPHRTVVATVRAPGGVLPNEVQALAKEPWARMYTVEGLSRAELDRFAATELGGSVHADVTEQLWQRTGGNPLWAMQVLRSARSTQVIERIDGVWSLATAPTSAIARAGSPAGTAEGTTAGTTAPAAAGTTTALPLPDSLRETIQQRVTSLGEAAIEAAQWLVGRGEVTAPRIEHTGRTPAFEQLCAAGIVRIEHRRALSGASQPTAVIAHPLYAEAIWESASPLRRAAVLREHFAAEQEQARPDHVRLAVLGMQIGEHVPSGVLLSAARLAMGGLGDASIKTVLQLALAALDEATGEARVETVGIASDALKQIGRAQEAVDLIQRELDTTGPGVHAIMLTGALHIALTWGLNDYQAARAMIAQQASRYPRWVPVVHDVFAFIEADALTYAGLPTEAQAVLDRVSAGKGRQLLGKVAPLGKLLAQVQARVVQSRAHVLVQLARPAETVSLLTTGEVTSLITEFEQTAPSYRGNHHTILAHAATQAGDPRAGLEYAMTAYQETINSGSLWGRAWATCNIAASWLQIGNLDEAARWARRTIATARAVCSADAERQGIFLLSVAECSQGVPLADETLHRLDELPADVGYCHHHHPIGAAWRAHQAGLVSTASRLLAAGVDAAERDGHPGAVLALCHEWIRLGQPVAVVEQIERALAGVTADAHGPLATARLDLAYGVRDTDVPRFLAAAEAFAAHGMPLYAAEATALAAYHSTGRDATHLRLQANTHAAAIGSPKTPLFSVHHEQQRADPLTKREREIAELAFTLSNTEIADRLHLSVRTVESHLAHAYIKLGITSRQQLQAALR